MPRNIKQWFLVGMFALAVALGGASGFGHGSTSLAKPQMHLVADPGGNGSGSGG